MNIPTTRAQKLARAMLVALLLGCLPGHAQAPTTTSLSPVRNAIAAPRAGNVALTFSQPLAAASAGNVRVFSQQRGGQLVRGSNATGSVSGNTLTVNFGDDLMPGETVLVTVPPTVLSASGQAATPHVYQFTAAVGGTGTGIFVPHPTTPEVSVGHRPGYVTVGDVDGDGDLDLLTANFTLSTVSVRRNDGMGAFSGTTDVSVGAGPLSVAVVDVDADGDLDFLTLNQNANTVSVRLNDGAGTFSACPDVSVGTLPVGIAVGDVDGDGDLDFLTASLISNTLSVRLNNGIGIQWWLEQEREKN